MGDTLDSHSASRKAERPCSAKRAPSFPCKSPGPSAQCARVALSLLDVQQGDVVVLGSPALRFIRELFAEFPVSAFCAYLSGLPAGGEARAASAAAGAAAQEMAGQGEPEFLGAFSSVDELREACGGRPLKLFDVVETRSDALDPISSYQEADPVWRHVRQQHTGAVTAVLFWADATANEIGYSKGQWPVGEIDDAGLRAVVQMPDDAGGWLFAWSSREAPSVKMVDARGADLSGEWGAPGGPFEVEGARSADVTRADIFVNGWDYTPSHYMRECVRVEAVPLGSLARRVTRGTSLSGKRLPKRGFVSERGSAGARGVALMPSPSGKGPMLVLENDALYLDTSSILDDGKVDPQVIDSIPEGQGRYVVTPEDGYVLLIPRIGKNVALYRAAVPTLISNNLFVVFPSVDLLESRYFRYALCCEFVNEQVAAAAKPLSKEQVVNVTVPVVPPDIQESVVACQVARDRKVSSLMQEVWELESKSAFQLLREGLAS